MSVGTAGAIIGAGVLGAGASVAGGVIGGNAAKGAAGTAAQQQQLALDQQKALAERGLGILEDQNKQGQAALAPFVEAQKAALGQLQGFTDPNNPLYGQERDLATRQIQQQLAAQGLLRSRSQGDSLANLESQLNQQRLGVIQGLSGSGAAQASAGLSQGFGQSAAGLLSGTGQQIGSSLSQLGQILAQGQMGQAQALAGGVSGVGNAFQGTIGNLIGNNQYQSQLTLLQHLLGGGGGAIGGAAGGGGQIQAPLASNDPMQGRLAALQQLLGRQGGSNLGGMRIS